MISEACKDIECRVVKTAHDKGRKTGGLIKLYRNGVELPTFRNVWIDFVLINDENTRYLCSSCMEIDGKAYDVVIEDEQGRVYYDGWKRRERQTYYAERNGQSTPADTLIIEAWKKRQREVPAGMKTVDYDPYKQLSRASKERLIRRLNEHFKGNYGETYCKLYGVERPEQLSDEQLVEIQYELKRELSN